MYTRSYTQSAKIDLNGDLWNNVKKLANSVQQMQNSALIFPKEDSHVTMHFSRKCHSSQTTQSEESQHSPYLSVTLTFDSWP